LMVSVIGFGGGPLWKAKQARVVKAAIKMGVNYIDTAHRYGNGMSETIIGDALSSMRRHVYIATKTRQRKAEAARREILESLRRLKVRKIDILQMHAVATMSDLQQILDPVNGALRAVKQLQQRGLVDFIGITGAHGPNDFPGGNIDSDAQVAVCAEALRTQEFDTVQLSYNTEFHDGPIADLIDLAASLDVGVICKKPLGAGRLVGKYTVEELLEFVLSNPKIHTAIPGMATLEHVLEDVPAGYS